MATIIRATCPTCGDVQLSTDQVIIRTCVGRAGGEYRWRCQCGIVVKYAEPAVIHLLRNCPGVKEEIWELPLELIEHPDDEGVLTEDGLIDLELAFEDGSLYQKIAGRHFK